MTTTSTSPAPQSRIDWTQPVLWLFAIVLIALILLPLSWLAVYSFTDKARHPTLQNFVTLFSDPDFLDPLLTTAIIAISSAAIPSAGWYRARTCRGGRPSARW
jgi:iron(III) transport system permease protein